MDCKRQNNTINAKYIAGNGINNTDAIIGTQNIITNQSITNYPDIKSSGIPIKTISEFLNTFLIKYALLLFITCYLFLLPFIIYDHLNLQQSIFTITTAEHKIGISFFYFFSIALYYVVIKTVFLPLTAFFIKTHILKNYSYNGILFKDIRKIIITNHYFDSTLRIYKRDRVKPITYLLSDKDDTLMIQDVFSGYLQTEQFKAEKEET